MKRIRWSGWILGVEVAVVNWWMLDFEYDAPSRHNDFHRTAWVCLGPLQLRWQR